MISRKSPRRLLDLGLAERPALNWRSDGDSLLVLSAVA